MSIENNSWISNLGEPLAICAYMGAGAYISFALFNKLTDIVEYCLNKQFGDYTCIRRDYNNQLIVSINVDPCTETRNFRIQSITIGAVVATISSIAIKALVLCGMPSYVGVFLAVGSVVTPILLSMGDVMIAPDKMTKRWVVITEEEAIASGMVKAELDGIVKGQDSRGRRYSSNYLGYDAFGSRRRQYDQIGDPS